VSIFFSRLAMQLAPNSISVCIAIILYLIAKQRCPIIPTKIVKYREQALF
jgi:hypothetical protein